MKFFLVKNYPFHLPRQPALTGTSLGQFIREFTLPVGIYLDETIPDSLTEEDCASLKTLLENGWNEPTSLVPSLEEPPMSWSLKVAIGLMAREDYWTGDYVSVTGAERGNLLTKLENFVNDQGATLKVKLEIKKFKTDLGLLLCKMVTEEMNIAELQGKTSLYFDRNYGRKWWNPSENQCFIGIISITLLYHGNVKAAKKDVYMAVTLLEMGHMYDIPKLEESMKEILLSKPDNWYNVEDAMRLYCFARNLPNGQRLKMKAVRFFKTNFETFKLSPIYKELFMETPELAMELCDSLVSL